jgi:DNA-binding beta-propeller fold protein YncE
MRARALGVVLLLAACGGAGPAPPARTRSLPRPWTVVARYSARSLGLTHPAWLAVGADGDVYVTDERQRVTVVSPGGRVLRRWGRPGRAPGEFAFVAGDPSAPHAVSARIAVAPSGMVYVADSGNARVQAFTRDGRFQRAFGHLGGGAAGFLSPFDIVADPRGGFYVLDDQRPGVVRKFSAAGRLIWRRDPASPGDGDLAGHLHIAMLDAHGRLVLVSDQTGRVVYLDGQGHEVDAFAGHGFPPGVNGCDVTLDAAGNAYVTGCGRGVGCRPAVCTGTLVFDRRHRLVARWASPRLAPAMSPRFGPRGEAFLLGADGSLVRVRPTLPGA